MTFKQNMVITTDTSTYVGVQCANCCIILLIYMVGLLCFKNSFVIFVYFNFTQNSFFSYHKTIYFVMPGKHVRVQPTGCEKEKHKTVHDNFKNLNTRE